jgi:hypothetical protein
MPSAPSTWLRRFLFVTLACLVALLAGVGGWLWHETNQEHQFSRSTIGMPWEGWGTGPENTLRHLGAPPRSGPASSFTLVNPDGTKPESVSTQLTTRTPADEVIQYYQAACRRLGLQSPPAFRFEEDDLCEGRRGGYSLTVSVHTKCSEQLCEVFIDVRGVW